MAIFKKILTYVCLAVIICFFSSQTEVVASDELKKIKQLESLLQVYIKENAALKRKLQDLEARLNAMDNAAENENPLEDWQQNAVATDSDALKASKPKAETVVKPNYDTKFPKLDDKTICDSATFLTGTTGQ